MERTTTNLDARSLSLRTKMVQTMASANRGHLASAFSVAEILRVLYDEVMHYDPNDPLLLNRDRFLLSKGHGCIAQYVLLAEKGFFPESELWKFCQSDGILGGHPDHKVPGVEASTGALGHGLSIGVGFALNARFEKSDHRTFVVIGDGESNEGSIWEGAMCAGKHHLSNLTVMVDYNKNQSYGPTFEIQDLEPLAEKWSAFGFGVAEIDGHDVEQIRSALFRLPLEPNKPSVVICHTVKGKGADFMEGDMEWHHKNRITDEELKALFSALEAD